MIGQTVKNEMQLVSKILRWSAQTCLSLDIEEAYRVEKIYRIKLKPPSQGHCSLNIRTPATYQLNNNSSLTLLSVTEAGSEGFSLTQEKSVILTKLLQPDPRDLQLLRQTLLLRLLQL